MPLCLGIQHLWAKPLWLSDMEDRPFRLRCSARKHRPCAWGWSICGSSICGSNLCGSSICGEGAQRCVWESLAVALQRSGRTPHGSSRPLLMLWRPPRRSENLSQGGAAVPLRCASPYLSEQYFLQPVMGFSFCWVSQVMPTSLVMS
jgi:hypothetical protein